jgi:hypothetical protein
MNRTTYLIAIIMALISPSFAQFIFVGTGVENIELVDTNYTGLQNSQAVYVEAAADLHIESTTITGGSGAEADPGALNPPPSLLYGGYGALFVNVDNVLIDGNSSIYGGSASSYVNNSLPQQAVAFGSDGVAAAMSDPSFVFEVANATVQGGDGSKALEVTGPVSQQINAYGGIGFNVFTGTLKLSDGAEVYGGAGGNVSVASSSELTSVYGGNAIQLNFAADLLWSGNAQVQGGDGGTFSGDASSIANANGGAGLAIVDVASPIDISAGIFEGGSGGTVNGSSSSTAQGGAGMIISSSSDVTVSGGQFVGGTAGTLNGMDAGGGAAIEINNSTVSLAGGVLEGDLLLSGGASTLSLQNTFTDDARVVQIGGTADFELWNDNQLANVFVEDGTMNFNNQSFDLKNGSLFTLVSSTASANFNNGLTVRDGAMVELGLGTMGGSNILLENGAKVQTTYDGTSSGTIAATGSLTVEDGVTWTIDAGDTVTTAGTTFDIASAGTLTSGLTFEDVVFVGTGGTEGWVGGINALSDAGNTLTATYGASPIAVALGVAGDTSTEFGKAMNALSAAMPVGSEGYDTVKLLADTAEEGGWLMTNAYVRTTEMGSVLVGLQSTFSDQIQDRVRSRLRFREVGYPKPASPSGPGGWDSMRTMSDRMEDAISLDGMRSWGDRMEDTYGSEQIGNFADNVTPKAEMDGTTLSDSWQAWGRGYGAFIEQDDIEGYAGYDAGVAGVMVGMDKAMNNVLLGIGGGYTRTDLEGYEERDADSDTGHITAYFATHGERAYLDASATYAFNAVETEYDTLGYSGDYNGLSLTDLLLLTPELSLLNTLYNRDSYTEKSTLGGVPALAYGSYDQWSHLVQLGATLNTIKTLSMDRWEMGIQPEVRLHWLRELNAEWDDETYSMIDPGTSIGLGPIGATPMPREEDLIKMGAGLRLSKWSSDMTELGIDFDGVFGSDGYDAYIFSGKILHRF